MSLSFHDITFQDFPAIDSMNRAAGVRGSQYSLYNLYCLRYKYNTRVCFYENSFIVRQTGREGGLISYLSPPCLSEWEPSGIRRLARELSGDGEALIWGLDEAMARALEAACPEMFYVTETEDWADYLYDARTLADMPPKHPMRRKVNAFRRGYACECTPIERADIPELISFQRWWMDRYANGNKNPVSLEQENRAIHIALSNWDRLGLYGLCCRIDGGVRGFIYGKAHTDEVFMVHAVKSDTSCRGLGVYLLSAVASLVSQPIINFEEDIGLPGLRTYKERLMPCALWRKYMAAPAEARTV